MKKVTEYLFGTVLPCFVKIGKKYATLVIAYLKRSFEEKKFHSFLLVKYDYTGQFL